MEEKFRSGVEGITKRTKDLEEMLADLRKKIVTDFTDTIAKRFERVEISIEELNDTIRSRVQGQIDEIKDRINQIEQKRIEEEEMRAALDKLADPERQKIMVKRKLLDRLKK